VSVHSHRAGVLLCLVAAAAFSSSTVFGRLALDDGAGVMTILALRYTGAALLFWALVAATGLRLPGRTATLQVLALGAGAMALQAVFFYSALARLDAGLVTLLLYTFPAIVAVGSIVIGREQPSRRKVGAVAVATAGAALVFLGDASLGADMVGVLLALGAAIGCAVWLLAGDHLLRGIPPLVVSALAASGAGVTLWLVGFAVGGIAFEYGAVGWGAIFGTVVISTGLAISTSMAGMARVGPTVTSVLLTVEVPLAVTWALVLLGERLQPMQFAGGALVVLAILLLQVPALRWPGGALARYAPPGRVARLSQESPPAP
jgi:drug/metabolite transporter (DMT)-like permease